MEVQHIQSLLKEIDADKYNIHNYLIKTLRIAQGRLDIETIIFLRLNKITFTKDETKKAFDDLKILADNKGLPNKQYLELFNDGVKQVNEIKSVQWYDKEKKGYKNNTVIMPVSEIIEHVKHLDELIERNEITEGLHSLDLYYDKNNKNALDTMYLTEKRTCKTILNKIKDYIIDYLVYVESSVLSEKEYEFMDAKKQLEVLIEEGYEVKKKCFKPDIENDGLFDCIQGSEYVSWLERCKIFMKKNVSDKEIYINFSEVADRANGYGVDEFETLIGKLTALRAFDFSEPMLNSNSDNDEISKIFISHSSKDLEYVRPLVDLLNGIGIKKSDKHIFCSSLAGYDIPYNQNIYDFLKDELNRENIMVLFVLSDNYYSSAPCLNEMGAAWITSKESGFILTPNFDFSKVKGAVDSTKISLKMDEVEGLDKFKDSMVETFELEDVSYRIWQEDRDKFVKQINEKANVEGKEMFAKVMLEKIKRISEGHIEVQLRFINSTDRDIEFKYIDIQLIDEKGNKLTLNADEYLDEFWLYSYENKIVKWEFENGANYNPRRANSEDAKVVYEIQ